MTYSEIGKAGRYVRHPGTVCDFCRGTRFSVGRTTSWCIDCGTAYILPPVEQKVYLESPVTSRKILPVRASRSIRKFLKDFLDAVAYARRTTPAVRDQETHLRTLASWHRWSDGSWNRFPE